MSIELNTQVSPAALPARPVDFSAGKAEPSAVQASKTRAAPVEVPRAPPVDMAKMQKELEEAIGRLNEHMKRNNTQLSFSIDNTLNQVVVVVKNQESGKVIRQLPNEAALRMAHHFEEMRGFLEDHNI